MKKFVEELRVLNIKLSAVSVEQDDNLDRKNMYRMRARFVWINPRKGPLGLILTNRTYSVFPYDNGLRFSAELLYDKGTDRILIEFYWPMLKKTDEYKKLIK